MGDPGRTKYYEFEGSFREMGRQYGEACRNEISYNLNRWYEVCSVTNPGMTAEEFSARSVIFEEPVKNCCPEAYEMILGISEGSGLPVQDIIFINSGYEMGMELEGYAAGCTSFAAAGRTTADNKTIVGQNMEWHDGFEVTVMKCRPDNAPAFLALTFAGMLAHFGISEAGFGHFGNGVMCMLQQTGPTDIVITQKIFLQTDLSNAVRCITTAEAAIAVNHLMAHKDGQIIDVESCPGHNGIILPDDDILVHGNHFNTPSMKQYCVTEKSPFADSFVREYRLKRLMEERKGSITPEVMMELLQDHQGYPKSICRHMGKLPDEGFHTVSSMVAVPEEGKMWATDGNPCENEYVLYSL